MWFQKRENGFEILGENIYKLIWRKKRTMATYEESTADWLSHYFGNYVGQMKYYHCSSEFRRIIQERDRENQTEPLPVRLRQEFCKRLQDKIDAKVPEQSGVTYDHLREMIDLAQGDWNDINTIKALSQRYKEISKNNWDLEAIFKEG